MSSGSPSVPPVPNPNATAQAQTGSNVDTAAAQAALNYTNQFTPYGSTTYQQTGSYTGPSGATVPTFSQYTALSPLGQSILTGEQNIASSVIPQAQNLAQYAGAAANNPLNFNTQFANTLQNWQRGGDQLNTGLTSTIMNAPGALQGQTTPFDTTFNSAPGQIGSTNTPFYPTINAGPSAIQNLQTPYDATLNQGPQLLNQDVTNAIYGQQKGFLDPQWNQQQTLLQDQLSRQGIPVGSEAYNNASTNFANQRTQAYQSAQDAAIAGGSQAASNLFNMALAGRGQDIGQQQAAIQAALQGQGLLTGQQQAAFNAALQGRGQDIGQLQSAIQAAQTGQQLTNAQQNQAFNQALSGQQQNISQQQIGQQAPISLLQSLLGAAPATQSQPIATPVPNTVQPTNVLGAQQLSTNAAMQNYQAQLAQQNAMFGGLASLGGAGLLATLL